MSTFRSSAAQAACVKSIERNRQRRQRAALKAARAESAPTPTAPGTRWAGLLASVRAKALARTQAQRLALAKRPPTTLRAALTLVYPKAQHVAVDELAQLAGAVTDNIKSLPDADARHAAGAALLADVQAITAATERVFGPGADRFFMGTLATRGRR